MARRTTKNSASGLSTLKNTLLTPFRFVRTRITIVRKQALLLIDRRPLASFFALLGLVLLLIILGNTIFKAKPAPVTTTETVKEVHVYTLASNPTIRLQAQVEKTGVVTISSLTSGVVSKIYAREGKYVKRGQTLAYISTNSHGGNVASVQSSIAQKQLENMQKNLETQKDISSKQRDLYNKTTYPANGSLQTDILNEQSNFGDQQLDQAIEIQQLQTQIAKITAAMSFPSAPFTGTIQRVLVKEGQVVSPGTPLMIIAQDTDDPIVAIAYAPRDVAENISLALPATIHLDTLNFEENPSFITSDAISGTLYGIYFPIPEVYNRQTTEKGYLEVEIPVAGITNRSYSSRFIPLEAVYQTREKANVFVVENDTAISKEVVLGEVYGSYIEVVSGLKSQDLVILDRTVVQGDKVTVKK